LTLFGKFSRFKSRTLKQKSKGKCEKMSRRVIYDLGGTKIGEVVSCPYDSIKELILDESGSEWGEIEKDIDIPGKEIIYRHGKKWGEIDNYTGREIVYDKHGREWGEVKLEHKDDITFADLAEPVARPILEGFISLFNPARLYEAMASVVVGFGLRLMLLAGGLGLLALGLMVFGNIQGAAPKVEDFWYVWNWQDAMSAYLLSRITELLGSFVAIFIGCILITTGVLAGSSNVEEKKLRRSPSPVDRRPPGRP